MPTLTTIRRSGKITHVAVPRVYNISGLDNKLNGSKVKTYRINDTAKHTILSSLAKMYRERKNNITFWTFSFIHDSATSPVVANQKIMNQFISKFFENLKKTYGLVSYLWVSERQSNGGIHYHTVLDIPFVDIHTSGLKNYLMDSFKNVCMDNKIDISTYSYCASIGFPRKIDSNGNYRGSVVRSLESLATYLGGYISKNSENVESGGRLYAISRNVLQKPVKQLSFEFDKRIVIKKQYEHKYCTVRYAYLNRSYDDYFLRMQLEKKTSVASDFYRKMGTRVKKVLHRCRKKSEICRKTQYLQKLNIEVIGRDSNFSKIYRYLQKMPSKHFENEEVGWHEWAFNNKIYHSIEYF